MKLLLRFFLIGLLFLFLVFVRAFAAGIFYDPFIDYFKNDYLIKPLPSFNSFSLYLNLFFRYMINSCISVGILFLLFKKQFLKFSIQFFSIAIGILLLLLFMVLNFSLFESYLPLFYIRRFIIHPIFLLILIPAFYYQKRYA